MYNFVCIKLISLSRSRRKPKQTATQGLERIFFGDG
jgi:hypothetical protein